jgi:ABC-type enterochelin transport system permease subunit
MSSQDHNERYVVRPWWRMRSLPWAALVLGAIIVTAMALERTTFFDYAPTPEFLERLRVGRLIMLAGAAMSLAAAVWSQVRGNRLWVTICVASPALLVGMAIMIMTTPSRTPQIAGLIALPAALAGLIGGVRATDHE